MRSRSSRWEDSTGETKGAGSALSLWGAGAVPDLALFVLLYVLTTSRRQALLLADHVARKKESHKT
jgi:hypothetical protein